MCFTSSGFHTEQKHFRIPRTNALKPVAMPTGFEEPKILLARGRHLLALAQMELM